MATEPVMLAVPWALAAHTGDSVDGVAVLGAGVWESGCVSGLGGETASRGAPPNTQTGLRTQQKLASEAT